MQDGNTALTSHEEKEEAIYQHFSSLIGSRVHRRCTLNWETISLPEPQLDDLDLPFSEAEVWAAVIASPAEKAPGPDGFTGQFFRSCWSIIKGDIMAVFDKFYRIAGGNFADLNKALIALLPKKDEATQLGHFRPISLIHSVAKLIAKVLSIRLGAKMDQIISPAQSAFQKAKCIHDSFLYVQGCVRSLHRRKKPALLFKLDIAKAFDSVSWDYLLELLQRLGFSARWRGWISLLLSSASSSCLLNGIAGRDIVHRRGLR